MATHPSDLAVALTALDAVVCVQGPAGERTVPIADLHRLPGDEPQRDTTLEHGELITAIELAPLPYATRRRYRKVRDRASYSFALVSVAAVAPHRRRPDPGRADRARRRRPRALAGARGRGAAARPAARRGAVPARRRGRARGRPAAARQRLQGPAGRQRDRAHADGDRMSTTTRAIGAAITRIDGPAKVTGEARYAFEHHYGDAAYAHAVQSTVARGRITAVDTDAATALPGVLTVLTHLNAPRLANPAGDLAVLQSDAVAYHGQVVALAIAETPEVARHAAALVTIAYDAEPPRVELRADDPRLYTPDHIMPQNVTDTFEGDADAALAAAPVSIDCTYTTPNEHNQPMEPHACVARWTADGVTIHDANQGSHNIRAKVADVFGLPEERVRVTSPHVGGGFGSKVFVHPHLIAAVMASRAVERPVKIALTRQQMFSLAGHRTPTIQRVRARRRARRASDGDRPRRGRAHRHDRGVRRADGARHADDVRGAQPPHDAQAGGARRARAEHHARAGRGARDVRARVRDRRAGAGLRDRPGRAAHPQRARDRRREGPAVLQPRPRAVPARGRGALRLGGGPHAAPRGALALRGGRRRVDVPRPPARRERDRARRGGRHVPRPHRRHRHRDRRPDGAHPDRRRRARRAGRARDGRDRRLRPARGGRRRRLDGHGVMGLGDRRGGPRAAAAHRRRRAARGGDRRGRLQPGGRALLDALVRRPVRRGPRRRRHGRGARRGACSACSRSGASSTRTPGARS